MPLIFVYGSLKRGFSAEGRLDGSFQFEASTEPTYRMYDYGGFPGVVEVKEGGYAIKGEVWEISEACLPLLDQYEAVDEGLYVRATVKLAEPYQHMREVIMYLYARDVSQLQDVGGVWKRDWDQ
ncbi:MAG: gamma-glutamylcyclotransferase family protein [Verrucomicrobiota bacterium]